jgi:hypothetical protein
MAGTIGIKIANGDFYPILDENSPAKKRLVLTTVHDKQHSVQIDLYRSISKSMLDAQYIGRLEIEHIRSKPKGTPSIEMILSLDGDGNVVAEAYDIDQDSKRGRNSLNVALHSIDLQDEEESGFSGFSFDDDYDNYEKKPEKEESRKFPWLIMGLATLFVAVVIAALWFFFLGGRDIFSTAIISRPGNEGPPPPPVIQTPVSPPPVAPPLVAPPPVIQPEMPLQTVIVIEPPAIAQPPVAAEPSPASQQPVVQAPVVQAPVVQAPVVAEPSPASQPPVIQAPVAPPAARPQAVERTRPPAPVSSYRVPAVIPRNGIVYQIQWGDTLWEISEAFYRNPWLYTEIARHNNIRNPNHIIAGSNVRIPPRN